MKILFSLSVFILNATFRANSIEFFLGDCPVLIYEDCRKDLVKFTFYSKTDNNFKEQKIDPYNPELPHTFNRSNLFKIVIHGYGGVPIDKATTNVTKAYLDEQYNLIFVDWTELGRLPCYATAYINSWHVGDCVALLTTNLIKLGILPQFTHVVGFSLGAHIAGFAGTHIKKSLGIPYKRITGLDPALPFFATLKNDWKLDPSDATFVDVIHTSAGFFGKIEPTGDVDFYVNGGWLQPVCNNAKYPPLCSHGMAGIYFSQSIRKEANFVGIACNYFQDFTVKKCNYGDTAIMGEYIDPGSRGVYFVETSDSAVFSLVYSGLDFLNDVT